MREVARETHFHYSKGYKDTQWGIHKYYFWLENLTRKGKLGDLGIYERISKWILRDIYGEDMYWIEETQGRAKTDSEIMKMNTYLVM